MSDVGITALRDARERLDSICPINHSRLLVLGRAQMAHLREVCGLKPGKDFPRVPLGLRGWCYRVGGALVKETSVDMSPAGVWVQLKGMEAIVE